MLIREEIYEALSKTGLPCFYVSKKNIKADEYIIFSFTETISKIADCKEDEVKYLVYLNVYTKDDNFELKKKITNVMREIGFYKKQIPKAYYEESLDLFNQAYQFQGIRESEVI